MRLGNNIDALRERVEELSRNEEKIDAVYGELQQHAGDIRDQLKAKFTLAKTQFQTAVEVAVKETSDHALDTQSFVPADTFSQLLWFYDPGAIAAYQVYTFQANSFKEYLNSAFQVVLQFALPEFENLSIGQPIQGPAERIEELMKALALKEETHNHETEVLRKALADIEAYNVQRVKTNESAIQKLQRQLEGTMDQLLDLRKEAGVKESRYSALEKEKLTLVATQKELERKNTELSKQVREKEDQLTAASSKISALEQRCSSMAKQLKELEEVRLRPIVAAIPTVSLEKLIAVVGNKVQCFDVATSQWQQFPALRQDIQVDEGTASTFIPPNLILLCGGGFPSACTRHIGRSAYMLKGDGSLQELPHMSASRRCPGVAWDLVRQVLYVFGGFSDGGTCYTALRTSEMFLSKWSPLPHMHQARYCFNSCWHSSVVYLCGGYPTNSVEIYDPRSNTFALQDFTLPESNSNTTTVVESGVVTVISIGYISKLQQGRLTTQQHGGYQPWSNYTPIVSGGVVYVVSLFDNCCRCIDLTTGAVQKEVKLS